jgi:hypothetical protein
MGTKVISFRMESDDADQIEEIKAKTGHSNADLMKLGAGIDEEEIKKKMAPILDMETKLANLRQAACKEEQNFSLERERRRKEIGTELQAYRLYSAGWDVGQAALKSGMTEENARRLYEEWLQLIGDQELIRLAQLRGYLKKHLKMLKAQRLWMPTTSCNNENEKEKAELEEQIKICGRMLIHPEEIDEESAQFLITEYSMD